VKRFKFISAESDPNESAWDVLKQHAEKKSTAETGSSKRAERKVHNFSGDPVSVKGLNISFYFVESTTGPPTTNS